MHEGMSFVLFFNWSLAAFGAALPSVQVPHADRAPAINAAPGDPSWSGAAKIDSLQLSENASPGLKAIPQTAVLLQWDRANLYVRFVCEGDAEIYSPFSGRDAPYYKGDVVEVFLDVIGDGREYVELEVSPNNGVLDQIYLCTTEPKCGANGVLEAGIIDRDLWIFPSWNLDGLRTAARRNGKGGWIVDMAIPASILKRTGRKEFGPMAIRANFLRYDYPRKEQGARGGNDREFVPLNWSSVEAGCPHISPSRMGRLQLVENSP
jgi:hypothetical protein